MKVKELIKKLKKFDREMEVVVDADAMFYDIERVETITLIRVQEDKNGKYTLEKEYVNIA